MGGTLACVSCHGPNGQGGVHPMHMQTMDAPPITYDALVQMMVEKSGGPHNPPATLLKIFAGLSYSVNILTVTSWIRICHVGK